jgi:PKD repeat protein
MQVRDTGWLMNDTVVGVNIVDEAPIAAFTVTPASGVSTTVFTFDATTSQDLENGSAGLEVRWDWEDDGIWDDTWTSTKVFTHVFLVPGTYNVTLEVRDGAGLTNSTTKQVTVTLDVVAPVADAGEDQTVDVGELVTFDGSGSTDNIGIVNYTWSVVIDGSATYMYGASPSRTFTAGGEYEVTLVVMDAMGHTGTDTVLITVRDGKGSILADYWWLGVLAAVIITAFAAILLMRRRILI